MTPAVNLPYLDTSALAKWYLNESYSDAVDAYLRRLPAAWISSLTRLELRCLLARRRRAQEISAELEGQILYSFRQDLRKEHLRMLPLADEHTAAAMELMDSLPRHSLRTLDALHLAIVLDAGLQALVTADRTMAAAAGELGLEVEAFFPSGAGS